MQQLTVYEPGPQVTIYAPGISVDVLAPPSSGLVVVNRTPINLSRFVCLTSHHHGTNYQRNQNHLCLTTGSVSLPFECARLTSGALTPFAYPRYGLRFGDGLTPGVELATYTRAATTSVVGVLTGNLGTLPDGPYMVQIVAYDAAGQIVAAPVETLVPWWLWVDRAGQARNCPDVIFQNGSWDWMHTDGPSYLWARVPKAKLKTRVEPLAWWNVPSVEEAINQKVPGHFPGGEPFNTPLTTDKITRLNWVVTSDNGSMCHNRPSLTSRGITVTENNQAYSIFDFFRQSPNQHRLDGPRGVANVTDVTALWVGHAGSIYGCDGQAFWRVNIYGEKTTFAGMRHQYAPYWGEMGAAMPAIEIVGDWDASIPANKRWPWECWGLQFDLRGVQFDPTLPLVNLPPFGDLPQHLGEGMAAFLTCRFGRVLKAQFHKARPTDKPTMTEWITGLNDPWGLALHDNVLFVGERGANRIGMWSADTPNTYLGPLIENVNGALLGGIDPNPVTTTRKWTRAAGVTQAQVLAANIVDPEGLAYQDGFIYWGSLATAMVKRINVATGVVEVCCIVPNIPSEKALFLHLSLSDGTFGPRGTIFTSTGDVQNLSRPRAVIPFAGVAADGTPLTHAKGWTWYGYAPFVLRGPNGGGSSGAIYPLASAISNGMLATGGTGYGLDVFTKATLGEPIADQAKCQRGAAWYMQQGYRLIHGNYGFSHIDHELPWGENADCDYWLETSGHKRKVM